MARVRSFLGIGLLILVVVSAGCAEFKFTTYPNAPDYDSNTMCAGDRSSAFPPFCKPLP